MNDISALIETYFTLAPQADPEAYFAQFDAGAVVEDEGREHYGVAAIRAWRTQIPRVTYSVMQVDPEPTGAVAKVNISGDFPGGPVVLTFTFAFTGDGHIATLTIR